jgi:hypothetical protein
MTNRPRPWPGAGCSGVALQRYVSSPVALLKQAGNLRREPIAHLVGVQLD